MAIPQKDSELVPYSTNFNARIVASPSTFALSAAQSAAYTPLHDAYLSAFNAMQAGAKSKALVAAKDLAKAELVPYARELYAFVQSSTAVLDSDKVLLGVVVKKTTTTPIPPPADPPSVDIISVTGRSVLVRVHAADQDASVRRRPPGAIGAVIASFVGAAPPADPELWTNQGMTGKAIAEVTFPSSIAAGAQVWLTAYWFSQRKQVSPSATPITTYLQGGPAAQAA